MLKSAAGNKAETDTETGLASAAGSSKQPSAVPSEENSLQEPPPKEPPPNSEPATSGPNYAFIVSNDVVRRRITLVTVKKASSLIFSFLLREHMFKHEVTTFRTPRPKTP